MSHRKVTDRFGHDWDVWEVNPAVIDRRARDSAPLVDRRHVNVGFVGRVNERLRDGWLAFQSAHEKRRLAPVPPGWESLTDQDLLTLLERAQKAGKPARLIE
jgi:hypothetical protein